MSTLRRKQREIQERERMLLSLARRLLLEQGYAGLSMDRLAELAEYSKGTIYQHFTTKEDLVTALAIDTMERRVELFLRAAQFAGRSRERVQAIGVADEIFGRKEPQHYRSEFIINLAQLGERASAERREQLERLERQCFGVILEIAEQGRTDGDLPASVNPRELVFSIVTLVLGTHMSNLACCPLAHTLGLGDELLQLRKSTERLLDGFGWRPMSGEWDYAATRQRVVTEVFSDERNNFPSE